MIDWILENTLVVSVLALGLTALGRLLKQRPALLHVLWLVLLGRLVAPPIPTLSELPRELPGHGLAAAAERTGNLLFAFVPDTAAADSDTAAQAAGDPFGVWPPPLASDEDGKTALAGGANADGEALLAPSAGLEAQPAPSSPRQRWTAVLFALWLLGSGLMVVRQVRGVRRFQTRVRRGLQPSSTLQHTVARVARQLGVRAPRVRVLRGMGSPVVWSCGRAVLCWPATDAGEEYAADHAIVAHELAHLRRRDHWVAWLEVVALCTLWWNPVFWFVHRRMREQAELACDAWVVEIYPEERRRYAESLIDAAEGQAFRAGSVPALGATDSNVSTFRRRLEMILRDPVTCHLSPATLAVVTLFTLLVLPVRSIAGEGGSTDADELPSVRLPLAIEERVATRIVMEDAARAFERQDWAAAVAGYRELATREPENGLALNRLGYSLLATGEPALRAEAAAAFERQSALAFRVGVAEYNIACARALMGETELALEHLHRAVHAGFDQPELMDKDTDIESLRGTAAFAQHRAELDRIQELRETAARSFEQEQWESAAEALTELVDEVPGDGASWNRCGIANLKLDRPERAAECFARQAQLGHDEKHAWFELARLEAGRGELDAALECLQRAAAGGYDNYRMLTVDRRFDALRGEPTFEELMGNSFETEQVAREAWAAFDAGDWEAAAELYGELVAREPLDGSSWKKLGAAALRLGAYERAVEAFEQQAELGHELEGALLESSCAFARLGRDEHAVAYLQRAVDLGYDDADRLRRDPELASLRDHPGFQHAAMRAADLAFLGKVGADSWADLAEQMETRLVRAPDDSVACYRLGWACLRLGRYERAVEVFTQQDELGYLPIIARYNAACACSLSGDVNAAFEWLGLALEAGFADETLLRTDLDIARLRDDERFEALLARVNADSESKGEDKNKAKEKGDKKWKSKSASYED